MSKFLYKISSILVICFVLILSFSSVKAQSFKKGNLLLGVSEGSTNAHFSTRTGDKGPFNKATCYMKGERDPLMLEYGLTDHWGIGFSLGADIFQVNPTQLYGFTLPSEKPIEILTSECLLDFNYHFYSNKKFDFSSHLSLGSFSVMSKGTEKASPNFETANNSDFSYNYKAKGSMVRAGVKVKYYVWKRFGVLAMVSAYSGSSSPFGVKGNTVAKNISTQINGIAYEGGLCYRFY